MLLDITQRAHCILLFLSITGDFRTYSTTFPWTRLKQMYLICPMLISKCHLKIWNKKEIQNTVYLKIYARLLTKMLNENVSFYSSVKKMTTPLMILHSKDDHMAPFWMAEEVWQKYLQSFDYVYMLRVMSIESHKPYFPV